LDGERIPGASATASDNVTAVLDLGYFFTDRLAVSVTLGLPPTSSLTGTGTAAALNVVGRATYGPLVLSGHYHFTELGRIKPYVGAGLAYYTIFGTRDGSVTDLGVGNTVGPVLQVGADVALSERWALFLDLKRIWLQTKATGQISTPAGFSSATAKVTLVPLVVSAGVSLRF
jgi:outer membrane protein